MPTSFYLVSDCAYSLIIHWTESVISFRLVPLESGYAFEDVPDLIVRAGDGEPF